MITINNNQLTPCAEIITSSLDSFTAHCWQWNNVPPFGSIVMTKAGEYVLYGVVYSSKTESLDPMHTVHVYKKTEEEIRKEYPHLFDFLKTTFDVFILGYERDGITSYTRAPFPAQLYSFVCMLDELQLRKFFNDPKGLWRLTHNQNTLSCYEDILLTLIAKQKKFGVLSKERIANYVNDYSNAIQARYCDLQQFIAKIESL